MYTFLDENEIDNSLINQTNVSIISAPLACSVSWGRGTDEGPASIIDASKALETFDDELCIETYRVGIETLTPLNLQELSSAEACTRIKQAVVAELHKGRLPLLLGGEHTVTVPAVEACLEKYRNLHVLQIDAHLDLRQSYENNPLSHACVMRRIHDMGITFTQVGIRSFSRSEWEFVKQKDLSPFTMHWIRQNPDWLEKVCDRINSPLYITIDVDGFDPAVMPATGTPEPDGLLWHEATQLLQRVCEQNKIVGLDFVELAPASGQQFASFTVAKLIYRTLGYIFKKTL